jgi:hypothetical protein
MGIVYLGFIWPRLLGALNDYIYIYIYFFFFEDGFCFF